MRQRRVESISTARLKKGRGSQVVPPLAILWNTMELYVVGAAGSECIPRAIRQLPYITVLHEAAFRGTALDVCAIESVLRVLRSMRALQQPSSAKLGGFAPSVNSVLASLADFHGWGMFYYGPWLREMRTQPKPVAHTMSLRHPYAAGRLHA